MASEKLTTLQDPPFRKGKKVHIGVSLLSLTFKVIFVGTLD